MSREYTLLLCEYILETQLGLHIVEPVGRILIRGGAMSAASLIQQTGIDTSQLQNILAALIKHNLLTNRHDEFNNAVLYEFSHTECLLRLSMPRYLGMIAKSQEKYALLKMTILKETFLAGSLLKTELVKLLKRKKRIVGLEKQDENLEAIVDQVCGSLTLDHFLIGVSDDQNQSKSQAIVAGQRRRETKRLRKEKEKQDRQTDLLQAAEIENGALKVNMARFISEERRQAILALAAKKFYQESEHDDHLHEVFKVLVDIEGSTNNFHNHLSQSLQPDGREFKLYGVTVALLKTRLPKLSETKITAACKLLAQDRSKIVKELLEVDKKTQQTQYAINWPEAFATVKLTLMDQIVSDQYSGDHCRVMRVLRQKGFMEEKELVKLCLLPQQNIRAIVGKLMSEGLIMSQEIAVKGSSSSGYKALMYGVNVYTVHQKIGLQMQQAILNLLLRTKKLGKMQNMTLEMNHLNF